MRIGTVLLVLLTVCLVGSYPETIPQASTAAPLARSRKNELDLLRYIIPTLLSAGKGGRVYFRATCSVDKDAPVLFPRFRVQPPSEKATGADAVRSIFIHDNRVRVVTDGGVIRIRIAEVPDTLLQTKILKLHLDPLSQYNSALAIAAIEQTNEVRAAKRRLGLSTPRLPIEMLMTEPNSKEPHAPAEMHNISMDHALDQIAIAFKGVVFYAICPREHVFEVSFDGGVGFDKRLLYGGQQQ